MKLNLISDIVMGKINPRTEKARKSLKRRLLSELPMAALTEIHWKLVANRDGSPLSEMAADLYQDYVEPETGHISVKYWHLMEDSWNDMMSYMAKEAKKFLGRVLSESAEHAPSPSEVIEDALARALEKLLPIVRSGGFKWDSTLHTYATTILHNEILQILRGSNPISTPWFSKNYDDVNFGVFIEQLLTWQDPLTLRLRQESLRAIVVQLEHASDRRPTPALEQALIDGLNQALKDPLLMPAGHSSKVSKSTSQEPTSRHLAERNRNYLTSVYGPSAVHPPRQLASMRHPGEGVHIVSLEAEIDLESGSVGQKAADLAFSELRADLRWPTTWPNDPLTHQSRIGRAWELLDGGVHRLSNPLKLVKSEYVATKPPMEFAALFKFNPALARDPGSEPGLVGVAECSELGLRIRCARTRTDNGLNLMVRVVQPDEIPLPAIQVSVSGVQSGDSTQYTDANGVINVGVVDELLEVRVEVCNVDTRSLFDRYAHLFGTEHGIPPDMAENAEAYLATSGFGATKNPRKLKQ